MAIEIKTTPMVISYNRTPAKLSIEQPKAQVDSSITHAQVRVTATLPKVTIDQDQAFNESGLKNVQAFSEEYVAYAKQKAQESVARIASQGDDLRDVHKNPNAIADNARYNAYDQFLHEFGMVTMPRTRPQIDVIEGELDIQVQEGEYNENVTVQKPIIDYQRGQWDFNVEQYNSISFRYLGKNVDLQV